MAQTRWRGVHLRGVGSACALLALVALTLTCGCAVNSEMTNLWHDPTFTAGSVHNVYVVAIRKDPVRRRMWEDSFANALIARGVAAVPSYRQFPDAPPDTQQVIEAVRGSGYDAVLVSSRLPDEATSRYVPGAVRHEPVTSQDYYGRFHSYWVTVQEPGYTETDTIVRLQTDVWSGPADGGRLVSSVTLRTLESVSGKTVDHAVTEEIVPALEKQGMVPPKGH